jgi:uncharacterized damage-inducible protein DinB
MEINAEPEVWLRGPMPNIPALLQPVAHSLLQCRNEVRATIPDLSSEQLWMRPGGGASIGYHVHHAIGALDRLLTYARGEQLSSTQQLALKAENHLDENRRTNEQLVTAFDAAVERALQQLQMTDDATLLEPREVGRARRPSTVIGLLFHTAEHTQRHVGQLVTTAKVVRGTTSGAA